jgi:hypothetical protein
MVEFVRILDGDIMSSPVDVALKIRNYKSFGDLPAGFDTIRPLNIVIGRNNIGKSALLDLIEFACNPQEISARHFNQSKRSVVSATQKLNEAPLRKIFRENTSGGFFQGNHWAAAGRHLVGATMEFELRKDRNRSISLDREIHGVVSGVKADELEKYRHSIAEQLASPFAERIFRRVSAERDVRPESASGELGIAPNGEGLTRSVAHILNKLAHPTELVEKRFLDEINSILEPDTSFSFINVQELTDGVWEIFLEEENKGRIALSSSGSGLKTVFLLVAQFVLVPYIAKKSDLSQFVFAFEELENNLHPALQRSLFAYVHRKAIEHKCNIFVTTHSSAIIDQFSNISEAQIIHVVKRDGAIVSRTAQTYVHNQGILDDLDVRASDLLQSNGVVWLEGPSDRLYFNRWIELFFDGQLREGTHYQCVFYGGRLLSHLSAGDPDIDVGEVIKILSVNRNAILLMDSDKRNQQSPLNATRKRLLTELESLGAVSWVTKGKEIENYVPLDALQKVIPEASADFGQYEDFASVLRKHQSKGEDWTPKKIAFAEAILPHLSSANLSGRFDLKEKVHEVGAAIRKWNGLSQ